MEFQCKTCQTVLPSGEMMKHLSTTRHKTIVDNSIEEEVSCEDCQNDNIHQLTIVRFGGDDLNLFCVSCFNKICKDESEKPNTQYSLQNGAILNYWDKYLIVRDCSCASCGDNNHLNVKNIKKGETIVLCNKCLSRELNKDGFISEDSGKFVYALLDMPERSKTTKTTFKKKGGRNIKRRGGKRGNNAKSAKGAKGAKTSKSKKPLTALEKITRESFQYKKINTKIESVSSVDLSSFKGVKASNGSVSLKSAQNNENLQQNKSNKLKNNKKFEDNKKTKNTKGINDSKKAKDSKKVKEKTKELSWEDNSSWGESERTISLPKIQKTSIKANKNASNTKQNASPSKKTRSKAREIFLNTSKGSSIKETSTAAKPRSSNTVSRNSSTNTKESSWTTDEISWETDTWGDPTVKAKNEKSNNKSKKAFFSVSDSNSGSWTSLSESETAFAKPKKTEKKKGKKKTVNENRKANTDVGAVNNTERSKTKKKNTTDSSNSKKNNPNDKQSKTKKVVEEGTHLAEFSGSKKLLKFPNLTAYLNNFSQALFKEQKLENRFIEEFAITWPLNAKDNIFVINIRKNSPELQYILPPHLLDQGRTPFNLNQPLMFSNMEETEIWYTFVKEVQQKRDQFVVLLELFPWNIKPLPTKLANKQIKMLPLSVQTNRIIFSMTRLTNPKFVELLLGNTKIKEITFNNRLTFTKDNLNISQKQAVEHVLNNSVTIIQGPPGTGKTSTIEEVILQLIDNFNSFPILCVAASNIAIDNIAEKLLVSKPDLKLLRILSDRKEKEYDESHPLGNICLHNLINREMTPDEKQLHQRKRMGEQISKNADMKLYKRITNLTTKYVSQAQIIFTTNITAGGKQLKFIKELPVVIMDESTQSSEVSTLVPLSLPGIKNFVFVGDEKQLSSFSNVPELEMSLFERILYNGSYATPKLLDTQYRMHPEISEFPIKYIYGSKLLNGVTVKDKYWPKLQQPLYFYNCDKELETKVINKENNGRLAGYTYINQYECERVIETIYKLLDDKNVKLKDIGVVTPYSAQRDYICEKLLNDKVINPQGKQLLQQRDEDEFMNESYVGREVQSHVVNIINGLQVATIDSYQGHEKNFIIFSCVRNNKENNIGFLRDKRRLNVALTRSKYGLIVIGNKHTLSNGDPLWKKYINYCNDKGVIFNDLSNL